MSDTPDATTPPPAPEQPDAAAVAPAAPAAPLPPENAGRGTLLALLIVPAAIAAWSIVSAVGFISGWIPLLVSIGALALYRRGSGGRISYAGAIRVALIALGTIVVSFLAGPVIGDTSGYIARALSRGRLLEGIVSWYGAGGDLAINLLLVLAFTVLGIVIVFRTAAQQLKEQRAADAATGPGSVAG